MVENLQTYGVVRSKKVADVMEKVDRALFVLGRNAPYYDSPMPIGYNATISTPHMLATCLQLLEDNLQLLWMLVQVLFLHHLLCFCTNIDLLSSLHLMRNFLFVISHNHLRTLGFSEIKWTDENMLGLSA